MKIPGLSALPTLKEPWRKRIAIFVSSGVYSGFFPIASGTAGTVVGAGLVWEIRNFPLVVYLLLVVLLGGVGVWSCYEANRIYGKADSGRIVVDEIVGFMVTMIGIPITGYWMVIGFLLFRLFDVIKPPPADYCDEKMKSGWGVMLDDVVAGIYGNIILRLMLRASI